MDAHERAWLLHKSRPVMEATIANLERARSLPYALGPTYGRIGAFVVVGAGPSLSTTGPYLPELQKLGLTIATVNTALKAVTKYVEPDVVLAREVVDVSSHIDAPATLRVLDIGASPKVWAAAIAAGPCVWFCPGQQQTLELAMSLGVRPLYGGSSALTAMVALCEQWGATEVALVGCDLALSEDGQAYADGSAFSGLRAVAGPDGSVVYEGEAHEVRRAHHASGGIAPPPDAEQTTEVEGWGGTRARTLPCWSDQIPWLETFASRYGREMALFDLTGAGARKRGWFESPIAEYVEHAKGRAFHLPRIRTSRADVDAALADIAAQADVTSSVAATVLDPEGAVVAVPGYLRGCDVVEALAARDLLLGNESGASVLAKIRYAYGSAFPAAAMAAKERAT